MNKLIYTNGDNFYVFKGIVYDRHFPIEWAMNPRKLDNDFTCCPIDCLNCLDYGSYNGVFIGYCANCAQVYDYQRGNGFIDSGIEEEGEGFNEKNSVWNSYLKYVSLNEIGFLSKEEDEEIPWMNCEIDCSDEYDEGEEGEEEEEENQIFEPIYHYDKEYFEEGPPPLTMEDLTLEEEKETKKMNECLIN